MTEGTGQAGGSDRPALRRPDLPPRPDARPRIVDDPGILGFARIARSRFGSRLFVAFFAFVFALIAVQMIVAILTY
jgi:hypothetical protein